jgi:hypothetical protein
MRTITVKLKIATAGIRKEDQQACHVLALGQVHYPLSQSR